MTNTGSGAMVTSSSMVASTSKGKQKPSDVARYAEAAARQGHYNDQGDALRSATADEKRAMEKRATNTQSVMSARAPAPSPPCPPPLPSWTLGVALPVCDPPAPSPLLPPPRSSRGVSWACLPLALTLALHKSKHIHTIQL